jgi:hypothetical protein
MYLADLSQERFPGQCRLQDCRLSTERIELAAKFVLKISGLTTVTHPPQLDGAVVLASDQSFHEEQFRPGLGGPGSKWRRRLGGRSGKFDAVPTITWRGDLRHVSCRAP